MSGQGSLVKYNTPILVSTTNEKVKGGKKKAIQANASDKQTSQTEDILNSILPPRYLSFHFKHIEFFVIYFPESGRKMVIYGCNMSQVPLQQDWT